MTYFSCTIGWRGRFGGSWQLPSEFWQNLEGDRRWVLGSKWIKAALGSASVTGPSGAAHDAVLADAYPAVHEFLTDTTGPDGKGRQTSTLMLFVEPPLWKLCLNERDAGLSLWASGESLDQALVNLEERLTAPVVEWRRKPAEKPQKPGKRS